MTRARSLSRLANTNAFTVDASQNVGIGSTQPDVRLDVNGDMNVTGTLTYEDVTNVETAGITTTGGLIVTGLGATIGGITTFFGDLNFGAAGVGGTITTLGHGGFTGIVTALGFEATGVITAASFRGDGSQLSGVDSSNLVDSGDTNRVAANTSGIVVTGIATVTDTVKAAAGNININKVTNGGSFNVRNDGSSAEGAIEVYKDGFTSNDRTVLINNDGSATFKGDLTIPDKIIHDGDTNTAIRFPGNDTFTVETSGSEALRVDGGQRLLIGATSTRGTHGGGDAQLQIEGTNTATAGMSITRTSADAGSPTFSFGKTRNGSALSDGDDVGVIYWQGDDGTDLATAMCSIKGEVDGSVSGNAVPGRITFNTATTSTNLTERLRIDSTGRVLLNGGTTARANMLNSTFTSQFQIEGTGHTTSSMSMVRNTNDGSSPYLTIGKSRSTSVNGTGLVSSGDGLGVISWQGGDGSNLIEAAAILAQVDGTAATDDMPGRLLFYTTADGAAAATERVRIDSSGRVRIGSQSGSDRTSHRLQVSSDGSDSLLSLQNFSNSDGSEMDIAFYALNTNNASVKFAQIVARADETQANSSQQGSLKFSVNIGASLTDVAKFNTNGHFVPATDNTYDLGGSSERWRNIYSADLQLSNEGIGNDVDGTWGKYTIQEGENDLFLLNRRNGKKYRFMLEEV